MADELVHLDISAGIATVTLDSVHNRNALSRQLRRELAGHLDTAMNREDVRAIVLTHIGPVFCAGADLVEASDGDTDAERAAVTLPQIITTLLTGPKPVIARVAGSARAGGIGLIGACDIALAATACTFALTEVRIGVVAAVISVPLLPRLNPRFAQELFLTGKTFDASYAVQAGLLTRTVVADDLDGEVDRYAAMLAAGAPEAVSATKQLLSGQGEGDTTALEVRFAAMSALSQRHFSSAEAKEGIAAFRAKRQASWVPVS